MEVTIWEMYHRERSIIADGSVVAKSIPENVLDGGVLAKRLKSLR
jgi:acetyltransferase-like isoleucine patch superfamily enzyme